MNKEKIKVIVITGPTATGKTSLAVALARKFNGEIISADSRQVYRGLDLGTGKDINEYNEGGTHVKYHLINIADSSEIYNLKQFNTDAKNAIIKINKKQKLPIIAGGTVSYLDSLISDYKFPLPPPDKTTRKEIKNLSAEEIAEKIKAISPEAYNSIENRKSRPRIVRIYENLLQPNQLIKSTPYNQTYEWLIIAPYYKREEVHKRINARLQARIDEGMIEEVDNLHKNGIDWERLDSFGLEYRYISQFLKKEIDYQVMYNNLLAKIRRLARSQDIWFRKLENKGLNIYWLAENKQEKASELINLFLNGQHLPKPEIRLKDIYYGPKSS